MLDLCTKTGAGEEAAKLKEEMSPAVEVLVVYQGGHPRLGEKQTGWLRVDAQGLEFSPLTTTENYLRSAYEEIKDLVGPQEGTYPEDRIKSAHTRRSVVKGLGMAATMAGSLIPIPGMSLLTGAGVKAAVKAAEGLTMPAELGHAPKNRLTVVFVARGARSRASFDVVADTRATMEAQARAFAERFAEERARVPAPGDEEPRSKKKKDREKAAPRSPLGALKEHKALQEQGALTREDFERLKAALTLSALLREYKSLQDHGALTAQEYERVKAALTLSGLLRELKDLQDRGALTAEEFGREKGKLLAEMQARVVSAWQSGG
jgi:hypothetical protein